MYSAPVSVLPNIYRFAYANLSLCLCESVSVVNVIGVEWWILGFALYSLAAIETCLSSSTSLPRCRQSWGSGAWLISSSGLSDMASYCILPGLQIHIVPDQLAEQTITIVQTLPGSHAGLPDASSIPSCIEGLGQQSQVALEPLLPSPGNCLCQRWRCRLTLELIEWSKLILGCGNRSRQGREDEVRVCLNFLAAS